MVFALASIVPGVIGIAYMSYKHTALAYGAMDG
jgi:hypothetical protein